MNVTAKQTAWSEEQVRRFLREETLGYQRVDLPYGLHTGGSDRSATCRAILPHDLAGKTILDIGSLNGYFCFEALKRGAATAVGIEVSPERIRHARMLADCLGLPAEFRLADIEKITLNERFDYVLCLNVLHHLKNPLLVLEKLIDATRERLILEVASIGEHDRRKLGLSRVKAFFLRRSPTVYVQEIAPGKSGQKFFFTPGSIRNLLGSHRRVFSSVRILPSEHKERFMAIAERRRIGRLIVVAGPTSSGKSSWIEKLLSGQAPALAKKLGIEPGSSWKAATSGSLAALEAGQVDRLIFHYDFLRPLFKSGKTWDRDESLDVLHCAEEIVLVTMAASPGRLRAQLEQSEIVPHTQAGSFRGNKRHLKILGLYERPEKLARYYREWFEFCRAHPWPHFVVSLEDDCRTFPADEWLERLSGADARMDDGGLQK